MYRYRWTPRGKGWQEDADWLSPASDVTASNAPYDVQGRLAHVKNVEVEEGLGDTFVASTEDPNVALIIEAILHDAVWRDQAEKPQYEYRAYLGRCRCSEGCEHRMEADPEWQDMDERS